MVKKIEILAVLLLIFSCKYLPYTSKPINLYGYLITDKNILDFSRLEVRLNGYYYRIQEHKYAKTGKMVDAIFFNKTGEAIMTDGSTFESLLAFDKEVESFMQSTYYKNNVNRLKNRYIIKNDTIITQCTYGGDTFARHVSTSVYIVKSRDTLIKIKNYGLEIKESNEVYFFRKLYDKE